MQSEGRKTEAKDEEEKWVGDSVGDDDESRAWDLDQACAGAASERLAPRINIFLAKLLFNERTNLTRAPFLLPPK